MKYAQAVVPASRVETAKAFRYSPAVKAGPFVIISGLVGRKADGSIPSELTNEIELIFAEMEEVLTDAGASFEHIVSFDSFHVTKDFAVDLKAFTETRLRYLPDHDPAWTAIGVERLAIPKARLEVRVTAYLGA